MKISDNLVLQVNVAGHITNTEIQKYSSNANIFDY